MWTVLRRVRSRAERAIRQAARTGVSNRLALVVLAAFALSGIAASLVATAVATVVASVFASAAHAQGAPPQSPRLDDPARVAGWRADIDTLVATARRVHAGPTRPAHTPAFAQATASLFARIPQLSDARVTVEVQRLVAMLGDGHSLVYPMPSRVATFGALPIELYQFEDGIYVVGALEGSRMPLGARVERIGGVPIATMLSRMTPYVSRDNASGLTSFAGLYLLLPEFLTAWGASVDGHTVTFSVRDTLGRVQDIGLTAGDARRTRRRLFPPPGAREPVPLWLRDADKLYAFASFPEPRAVYLQVNQMMDAPGARLADIARMLGDSLRAHAASRLIVDVRHNNGGNNQLIGPLVDAIATFATDSARRVYVLTSRATFSAAQNFINRVEQRVPRTMFAGEPSMSRPNFTGEDNPVRLPWSGLMVSISNRYWQDSRPDDRRPYIATQIAVPTRMTDWLHNRDAVLEAVLVDARRPPRR